MTVVRIKWMHWTVIPPFSDQSSDHLQASSCVLINSNRPLPSFVSHTRRTARRRKSRLNFRCKFQSISPSYSSTPRQSASLTFWADPHPMFNQPGGTLQPKCASPLQSQHHAVHQLSRLDWVSPKHKPPSKSESSTASFLPGLHSGSLHQTKSIRLILLCPRRPEASEPALMKSNQLIVVTGIPTTSSSPSGHESIHRSPPRLLRLRHRSSVEPRRAPPACQHPGHHSHPSLSPRLSPSLTTNRNAFSWTA